jgi:hypothetical protein
MVMTDKAYFDFLALSEMPAHIGIQVTDRWKNVLAAGVAEFAKLPKEIVISKVTLTVKVLDADGQYRDKTERQLQ